MVPFQQAPYKNGVSQNHPQLICRKSEVIEVKYTPLGDVVSKIVSVRIEVYNNGSKSVEATIVDRVELINSSTLNMLYGTPKPTLLKAFGNTTIIVWDKVVIEAGSEIRYQYIAECLREPPIDVRETILVNGEPADVRKEGKIYMINANISDTVTFIISLKNVVQKVYTGREEVRPPLMCVVSSMLSSDSFSGLSTSPEVNSTSTIAGKTIVTWLSLLQDEPRNFTISARVTKVGAWGEVPVDPISIQIMSASVLEPQLKSSIEGLDASISMLENFTQASASLGETLYKMHEAIKGLENATRGLAEADAELVNALSLLAQGIYVQYVLLEQVESHIEATIHFLELLVRDKHMRRFLARPINRDLVNYLAQAFMNAMIAAGMIERIKNGDPETGLPGLLQIYNLTIQIVDGLNSTGLAMEKIRDGLGEVAEGLYLISNATQETGNQTASSVVKLKEEKSSLEDLMEVIRFEGMSPYYTEVRTYGVGSAYRLEVHTKPVNGGLWEVSDVKFENLGEDAKLVYGLAVQLKVNGTPIDPAYVEVNVNETWRRFEISNITQLGLAYDSVGKILYIKPRLRVNVTSSGNVLVDWLGHPIRIFAFAPSELEVSCDVDVCELSADVSFEKVKSQVVSFITQPHLFIRVGGIAPPSPPSPPPPSPSLTQVLLERMASFVQTLMGEPAFQIMVVAFVSLVIGLVGGFLIVRRRKKAVKVEVETSDLLREIEELEKILQEEN